jgi:uncharacterized protein YjiK
MTPTSRILSLPRPGWCAGILLAVALVLAAPGYVGRMVDRAFAYAISALQPKSAQRTQPSLPDYRVHVEAQSLDGIAGQLSGLAWDAGHDRLWAVADAPAELLALSADGEVLSRHPLDGFDGVSGIASLDDDRLLLVEKGRHTLVVMPAPQAPDEILRRHGRQALRLELPNSDQAIEGIGYDRAGDRLFVVQGHAPSHLYEIRGLRAGLEGRAEVQLIDRAAWLGDKFVARDFAAVKYDARTGHVLLLSNASRLILELDEQGRFVAYQPLAAGFAGLHETIPHAVAMSMDNERNLYVASTANRFYAFEPD